MVFQSQNKEGFHSHQSNWHQQTWIPGKSNLFHTELPTTRLSTPLFSLYFKTPAFSSLLYKLQRKIITIIMAPTFCQGLEKPGWVVNFREGFSFRVVKRVWNRQWLYFWSHRYNIETMCVNSRTCYSTQWTVTCYVCNSRPSV